MSGEAGDVERSKVRKFLTTSSQQLVPHNILPCLLHRHNGPHSKSPLTRSISRPCPPGLDHLLTKQTKHLTSNDGIAGNGSFKWFNVASWC